MNFSEKLQQTLGKSIKDAANEEIYAALLSTVKEAAADKGRNISEIGRKVYYISAEFLIGKLLSNNLINLGVYDEVRELLAANGKDICEIEEVEPEPSLGNGGLGRLAACFLDSIATLGLEGDGIGLNYHLGLFKQVFENHKQKETPNPWIQNTSWLTDTGIGFDVPFKDFSLHSKLYDIDVTGYENGTNKLHLFDIESVNENIVGDGIAFDKNDIRENLTLFLYPDDSDKQGELLRIYQQYFMVSNGAQFILKECEEKGYALEELDKHVVIQINDTHPSMVIPELIRLLGRMKFRTSYGQNALKHSIEVAQLSGLIAGEIGLDVRLAKRAGLLHDIGKSIDHDVEGSHIQIGVDLCRKYKESATVINAVEAHHGDVEPETLIACVVQAADTISAARPGARRETLETYTNRLKQLEDITNQFKGVDKSFAIQAGREIRVMVVPEQVSDADMVLLARDIAKQIEFELEYPGQIKVNVIRESRVTDYAK